MAENEQPLSIMICLVEIWTPKSKDAPMDKPKKCKMLAEVDSIEIDDTYKEPVCAGKVRFPRGCILKKTEAVITTQSKDNNQRQAAISGEIQASRTDSGIIMVKRSSSDLAKPADFNVGDRITIRLAYTEDPKIADLARPNDSKKKTIFNDENAYNQYLSAFNGKFRWEGNITKVSADTPIELECEDLGAYLRRVSCPNIVSQSYMTVNDFLSDKGRFKLLKGTGFKLYPKTEAEKIPVRKPDLNDDFTVADLLQLWQKDGLYSFTYIENNQPYIVVARTYFANAGNDSILKFGGNEIPVIDFAYHVADNGLTILHTDKRFLAVEARCEDLDGKIYHATIRLNQATNDPYDFQVVNETHLSKKQMKKGMNPYNASHKKIDISQYTVVPFYAYKRGMSHPQLIKDAEKFFQNFNMNGIDGILTLFGDLSLKSGMQVHLRDNRYRAKNGVYLVESVHTSYGVSGYRQSIILPYCISQDKVTEDNTVKK